MDWHFDIENKRELERLRVLVSRITDEELKLPYYKEGWTVAAGLAHLAFWDQYGLAVLRRWKQDGVVAHSHSDSNAVNDAFFNIALAMPPGLTGRLAVAAAEEIDREIGTLSAQFVKAVEALNEPFRLYRSIHRKLHLDEIEALLKARRSI
jgi:hypothetical protein